VACSGSKASPSASKDSHCRSGRGGGLAQVKDPVKREAEKDLGQAFRMRDDFDSNRTGQSFGLRGVAQTAARLSAKLRARLSPGPVFR
jgi:hypothetical protein